MLGWSTAGGGDLLKESKEWGTELKNNLCAELLEAA